MLRILFLNTWGGELHQQLHQFYRTEEFDVLCLTEIHRDFTGSKFMKSTSSDSRKSEIWVDQYDAVKELLPYHDGIFTPHGLFLHDTQPCDTGVQYGNAMFVSKHLTTPGIRTGMVFGTFNRMNNGAPATRTIQGVMVIFEGQPYVIVHFHGLWTGKGKEDTPERLEQSRRACEFLEGLVVQCRQETRIEPKVILGGDLNLTSKTQSLAMLAGSYAFNRRGRILNEELDIPDTRTSHYHKEGREADYVIVSENVKVLSFTAPATPEVSDHRPLIIECE